MKPPWIPGSDQGDMEALQTDVMRFMAILGLCLAAIFSLVKSADFRPAATVTDKDDLPALAAAETPAVEETMPGPVSASAEAAKRVAPEATPAAEPRGFELEFSSAAALRALLTEGGATLYRTDGMRYWRWHADGRWRPAAAPPQYREMDPGTLPASFRASLPSAAAGSVGNWGIVLPAATERSLTALLRRFDGGRLVIAADGSVSRETGQ